jgi:hypothetical protein
MKTSDQKPKITLIDRAEGDGSERFDFRILTAEDVITQAPLILKETDDFLLSLQTLDYFQAGSRLQAVRDAELFRLDGFTDFPKYYQSKGLEKSKVSRLIAAAHRLIFFSGKTKSPPQALGQIEPLLPIHEEVSLRIWKSLLEENGGASPSPHQVREKVRKYGLRRTRPRPISVEWLVVLVTRLVKRTADGPVKETLWKCVLTLQELKPEAAVSRLQAPDSNAEDAPSPIAPDEVPAAVASVATSYPPTENADDPVAAAHPVLRPEMEQPNGATVRMYESPLLFEVEFLRDPQRRTYLKAMGFRCKKDGGRYIWQLDEVGALRLGGLIQVLDQLNQILSAA